MHAYDEFHALQNSHWSVEMQKLICAVVLNQDAVKIHASISSNPHLLLFMCCVFTMCAIICIVQ